MGKLKPIGSEKLTGIDKISRILEIAKYKENIPQSINEDKSIEYSKLLPNGSTYQISKEKNGYVIKKSINESHTEFDYLEPMKNRKHYSSYSQAFKRLNLILKEVNSSVGVKENISLFEAADEATKYILKLGETEEQTNPETSPAPQPQPADQTPAQQPAEQPAPEPEVDSTPEPEETPTEPTDMDSEDKSDEEQPVTFKSIQKLTGKLSQKIREFSSNEENKMTSKDIKYVVNSVLSALNLNELEETDKEEIMSKFEGEETSENGSDDMGGEEETDEIPSNQETEGDEVSPTAPTSPEEMSEDFESMMDDYTAESGDSEDFHHKKAKEMFEDIFNESNVENVLRKYFTLDETEKTKKTNLDKIKSISENIVQEVRARKVIEKYSNAKLLGKNKKKVLVFEINGSKLGVTKGGNII